mgnify:CR=1 FL=1
MPQYKYPVKGGAKWMTKFNYTDPKSGIVKTAYKRGFDSKREAKKYEDDFIDSLIAPEEDEVEVIRTYGDVFQEYLMSHKRADIKESSLETKFNIFNKHIFPTFEEVPIDSITDDDIANWQKKMKLCIQPNGKHFSEAYLRTIQSQFNSIINYAFSKGYLKANPLADIKNMGIKDKRVEFWTPEEYERFAYHAMEYPQYYYVYEMLYWCGLRLGEMLALTLNDISEAKDVLTKKGITYKNVWFDSNSEAGKFASGLYSYPTTYVVDKNGNIVGQPIVGAITSSSQAKQLNKLIDQAIENSKK